MIGAIVGDVVGSVYEFDNHRSKDFEFIKKKCFFTDDTVMPLAVGKALVEWDREGRESLNGLSDLTVKYMREIGQPYPGCGYGVRFLHWMYTDDPHPYNSYGNGAAMRVGPVAYFAKDVEEAETLAVAVTKVTHNHIEGLIGASATAAATWMALHGHDKDAIREYIHQNYYNLNFTIDQIRPTYEFNETCQRTVPQAIVAFLESTDFEDAIRNAISVGGDSDTLAAITGYIAGAYYGVPDDIKKQTLAKLDDRLLALYEEFEDYALPY